MPMSEVQAPVHEWTVHEWTRQEYERMVAAGVFHPRERVELVDGEVVDMTPQTSQHSTAVQLLQEALRAAFPQGYVIRVQMPLALDLRSEPEPDIAVVAGNAVDFRDAHPDAAVLVVEAADSSLAYDRTEKARIYAMNGIADYWIVNLVDNCVEVHRDPGGGSYRQVSRYRPDDRVSPLTNPAVSIEISAILS